MGCRKMRKKESNDVEDTMNNEVLCDENNCSSYAETNNVSLSEDQEQQALYEEEENKKDVNVSSDQENEFEDILLNESRSVSFEQDDAYCIEDDPGNELRSRGQPTWDDSRISSLDDDSQKRFCTLTAASISSLEEQERGFLISKGSSSEAYLVLPEEIRRDVSESYRHTFGCISPEPTAKPIVKKPVATQGFLLKKYFGLQPRPLDEVGRVWFDEVKDTWRDTFYCFSSLKHIKN